MQLYLFRNILGFFYVDIYQQMSQQKNAKINKKMPKKRQKLLL